MGLQGKGLDAAAAAVRVSGLELGGLAGSLSAGMLSDCCNMINAYKWMSVTRILTTLARQCNPGKPGTSIQPNCLAEDINAPPPKCMCVWHSTKPHSLQLQARLDIGDPKRAPCADIGSSRLLQIKYLCSVRARTCVCVCVCVCVCTRAQNQTDDQHPMSCVPGTAAATVAALID